MNRSLFRYRKITEYSINELIEESIMGSKRDCFNDYYDFRLCYDKQMILNLLNEQKRTIANMIRIISEKNRNILVSKDALFFSLNDFIDWLENVITNDYYIACFSKKKNMEIMWNHYADGCKGFVLEYDFDEIDKYCSNYNNIHLKSVDYVTKRENLSNEMIEFINLLFDGGSNDDIRERYESLMPKIIESAFQKQRDWKYEKEYRLISCTNIFSNEIGLSQNTIIPSIKPKAIYVGCKCLKKDLILLTLIAKNKNIPIYEQRHSNASQNFLVSFKKMNKKRIEQITQDFILDEYDISVQKAKETIEYFRGSIKALEQ